MNLSRRRSLGGPACWAGVTVGGTAACCPEICNCELNIALAFPPLLQSAQPPRKGCGQAWRRLVRPHVSTGHGVVGRANMHLGVASLSLANAYGMSRCELVRDWLAEVALRPCCTRYHLCTCCSIPPTP